MELVLVGELADDVLDGLLAVGDLVALHAPRPVKHHAQVTGRTILLLRLGILCINLSFLLLLLLVSVVEGEVKVDE